MTETPEQRKQRFYLENRIEAEQRAIDRAKDLIASGTRELSYAEERLRAAEELFKEFQEKHK